MPAQCCDDLLNELQKFCYSFEPPGGWQLATKANDPTHWDGGAWCPPQAFETLAEDYSPKSCGEREGRRSPRACSRSSRASTRTSARPPSTRDAMGSARTSAER